MCYYLYLNENITTLIYQSCFYDEKADGASNEN